MLELALLLLLQTGPEWEAEDLKDKSVFTVTEKTIILRNRYKFTALNLSDGSVAWEKEWRAFDIAAIGNHLIIPKDDGGAAIVDAASGEEKLLPLARSGKVIVHSGSLYVSGVGWVEKVDLEGKVLFKWSSKEATKFRPTVWPGGPGLVISLNAKLRCVGWDGTERWAADHPVGKDKKPRYAFECWWTKAGVVVMRSDRIDVFDADSGKLRTSKKTPGKKGGKEVALGISGRSDGQSVVFDASVVIKKKNSTTSTYRGYHFDPKKGKLTEIPFASTYPLCMVDGWSVYDGGLGLDNKMMMGIGPGGKTWKRKRDSTISYALDTGHLTVWNLNQRTNSLVVDILHVSGKTVARVPLGDRKWTEEFIKEIFSANKKHCLIMMGCGDVYAVQVDDELRIVDPKGKILSRAKHTRRERMTWGAHARGRVFLGYESGTVAAFKDK